MGEKNISKSREKESVVGGWIESVKDSLVKQAGGVLTGLFESIERGVGVIVKQTLRHLSIFFFVLLGATFLLIGMAQVLDQVYQLPGVGKIIIGAVIFSLVLLLLMTDRYTRYK